MFKSVHVLQGEKPKLTSKRVTRMGGDLLSVLSVIVSRVRFVTERSNNS